MSEVMKQAQLKNWGGPAAVQVVEAPIPAPNMGHVLVKVEAAGVNPIDLFTSHGAGPGAATMNPELVPVVLGWDIAGTVAATMGDASGFTVGDRVFGLIGFPYEGRTFAEYAQVPAWQLAHAPEDVPMEQLGAAPLVALTAWQSLFEIGKLKRSEKVLIQAGAGGVGHVAIQLAITAGAEVYATASGRNREFVESLGATFIDYKTQDIAEVLGHTMNLVFDTVGGDTFVQSLEVLVPGGRIVTLGGPANFEIASERGFVPFWNVVNPDKYQMAELAILMEEGKVKIHVAETYPLAEVSAALERVGAGGGAGKVVLVP